MMLSGHVFGWCCCSSRALLAPKVGAGSLPIEIASAADITPHHQSLLVSDSDSTFVLLFVVWKGTQELCKGSENG